MNAPLVRRSPTHRGTVTSTHELTPRMRRVTVTADSLRDVVIRPAQDVELLLREPSGRRVKRRYTISAARPAAAELDLDVLLHGSGPGAAWGAGAAVGDIVEFQGPRGKLELRPATGHLLVGDESALPAIAAICTALAGTAPAHAVVEVTDPADEQPIPHAGVRWVHRGSGPPGTPELLSAALPGLLDKLGDGLTGARAYLLGETRAMVAIRGLLEARGVPHDDIFVKGYWNVGRPDRLAGRTPA